MNGNAFCYECGAPVRPGAVVCVGCGRALQQLQQPQAAGNAGVFGGVIRVTRGSYMCDRLIGYKIIIDGVERGDIKNNETKEFKVDGGAHTVCAKVKLSWCGSPELQVFINNTMADIEIGPSATGWKLWLGLQQWYMFFAKNNYLFIRQR